MQYRYSEHVQNPLSFKDEPHFQMTVLERGVPLKYKGEMYFPIVAEYPASPGIDLIYGSTTGKLLLAEFKYHSSQYVHAQLEAIHHYMKCQDITLRDIIEAASRHERNVWQEGLAAVRGSLSPILDKTLQERFEEGCLEPICVFDGVPPAGLQPEYAALVFLTFSENVFCCAVLPVNPAAVAYPVAAGLYKEWSKIGAVCRMSIGREKRLRLLKESGIPTLQDFLRYGQQHDFLLQPGTGKALSLGLQCRDASRVPRTLITCYAEDIQVPGNLYSQCRSMKIAEADVDAYFRAVRDIFPDGEIGYTPAHTMRIPHALFDAKTMQHLMDVVLAFRETLRAAAAGGAG